MIPCRTCLWAKSKVNLRLFSFFKNITICKLENLLIEDTLVMDQLEKLRHNVDELTLTAKSRARVATEVG